MLWNIGEITAETSARLAAAIARYHRVSAEISAQLAAIREKSEAPIASSRQRLATINLAGNWLPFEIDGRGNDSEAADQ